MKTAYLRRLGLSTQAGAWGPRPGAEGEILGTLARAHLAAVPFENLAIHTGEPATTHLGSVLAKLVEHRRGGICYELNGGLGWLLEQLGWTVAHHGARVLTPAGPGLPLGHLTLVVSAGGSGAGQDTAGPRWLVDVGFGGDLVVGALADTVPGAATGASEVPVRQPSGAPVNYLLETRSRPYSDFAGMAWWQSTCPTSRFTTSLICSRTRDGVRHTLSGRQLKVTRLDLPPDHPRAVVEHDLVDEQEVLACYRDTFGITLEVEPVPARFG